MKHKDGDTEDVVGQMLQDHRENPKGRIDRRKYVGEGHPANEVRKAAETAAKIWPILDKYGNILESEETIKSLRESLGSLQERVKKNERGKPEREELERKVHELEKKIAEEEEKYRGDMEELERLRKERSSTRSVNVDEMEYKISEQQKEISRLKVQVNESTSSMQGLNYELVDRDEYIKSLQHANKWLDEASSDTESAHKEEISHERSRFLKMFIVETAVLAILLVLLFVSHALNVVARGIVMAVGSFTSIITYDIHLVTLSLKLIALAALHSIELHLSHFFHSLVSSLVPVAVFFVLIILILLIVSTSNKR